MSYNSLVMSVAGSTLYGFNLPSSDTDLMGVVVSGPELKLGLQNFESIGKDDKIEYELKKCVQLIVNGNPSVTQLAYAPPEKWLEWDSRWPSFQSDLRNYAVSERCRAAFLGYLNGQRIKLERDRGQREDLKVQYGYDTKFAAHMVRLALQGIEMMEDGWMKLPMSTPDIQLLKDIRMGKWREVDVMTLTKVLEERLKTAKCVLRPKADLAKLDKIMMEFYKEWWGWR